MAFWGIEVKPGKPYTHSFDGRKGRLHISQATLGTGSADRNSLLQCNIGNKRPVLLCCLMPCKTESCSLSLEFEEVEQVIFSVVGPRSVHLTGYYLSNGRNSSFNEDSGESYGEDIADTESEESNDNSEEDDYEDSFIDDGELETFPSSPDSSGGVWLEEKRNQRKSSHRRLKKKYQLSSESDDENSWQQLDSAQVWLEEEWNHKKSSHRRLKKKNQLSSESDDENSLQQLNIAQDSLEEKLNYEKAENDKSYHPRLRNKYQLSCKSDDENSLQQPNIGKGSAARALFLESDSLDNVPLSSLYKSAIIVKHEIREVRKAGNGIGGERSHKKLLDDGKAHEDTETSGAERDGNHSIGSKMERSNDVSIGADLDRQSNQPITSILHSTELAPENGVESKKKRKERSEGVIKNLEAGSVNHQNDLKEKEATQDENMDQGLPQKEENQSSNSYEGCAIKVDELANKKRSGEKKIKSKKKKSKTQGTEGVADTKISSVSPKEKKSKTLDNGGDTSFESHHLSTKENNESQLEFGSDGLVVEEITTGKPDGKVACQGKKVSVFYAGKLKESGQIFATNIGGVPFKFRLGTGKVIKGWDVGLDGMRVGDKRRLTIPPSMGYGNEGDGKSVPPNSWLEIEVELVGAR